MPRKPEPKKPAPKNTKQQAARTTARRRDEDEDVRSNVPATRGGGAVSHRSSADFLAGGKTSKAMEAAMDKAGGQGLSTDASDNLIPMVYILQNNSPQVIKRNEKYIDGAEAGHVWLRHSAEPLAEDIWFQPCYHSKDWVEWVPRKAGGGFVGRHEECPSDCKVIEDEQNPNRKIFVRPNGNEVIETRYYAGYVLGRGAPLPYVIPLKSTGHTFGKQWMTTANAFTTPSGRKAPLYSRAYHLTVKHMSNAAGDWFMFELGESDWVNEEQFAMGAKLHQQFASGEKGYEAPEEDYGGASASDDM